MIKNLLQQPDREFCQSKNNCRHHCWAGGRHLWKPQSTTDELRQALVRHEQLHRNPCPAIYLKNNSSRNNSQNQPKIVAADQGSHILENPKRIRHERYEIMRPKSALNCGSFEFSRQQPVAIQVQQVAQLERPIGAVEYQRLSFECKPVQTHTAWPQPSSLVKTWEWVYKPYMRVKQLRTSVPRGQIRTTMGTRHWYRGNLQAECANVQKLRTVSSSYGGKAAIPSIDESPHSAGSERVAVVSTGQESSPSHAGDTRSRALNWTGAAEWFEAVLSL